MTGDNNHVQKYNLKMVSTNHMDYGHMNCIKKDHLSVLQDYKDVELPPKYHAINSNIYSQQLMKLDEAIKEKQPKLANRQKNYITSPS